MNLLTERIPMLIARASSFEADRSADLLSLRAAEGQLRRLGMVRQQDRLMRHRRAMEIATTWFSVTGDASQVERSLHQSLGFENTTKVWVEIIYAFRRALNLRWDDRSQDDYLRRYLFRAEELADNCADWCECVSSWQLDIQDNERALKCLHRAEEQATTFFDALACANAWTGHDYQKVRYWVAYAAKKTVTAYSWLRCAQALHACMKDDLETREDIERYLARAEEITRTFQGFTLWVSISDLCLGARGIESVMRGLTQAESRIRDMSEWCIHLQTVLMLLYRAQNHRAPVAGVANIDELKAYYRQCLKKFVRCRPKTQDWLTITKKLYWKSPDDAERNFMARAEAVARSPGDWQACANQWIALKFPDSLKKAIVCRLCVLKVQGRIKMP